MTPEILQAVIHAYGLPVRRILPMQSGYRNKNYPLDLTDGTRVNLVFYKREPNIVHTVQNARAVGNHLWQQGFPARHTHDPRILRIHAGPRPQYAGVYAYLPGETIPWECYTMKHLKSLGAAMSNMHALLADMPHGSLPSAATLYEQLYGRMANYFSGPNVQKTLSQKLSLAIPTETFHEFSRLIPMLAYLPAQQPLHLDFVRSNIVFTPGSANISGVLDFEKTAIGNPIIDIARTLAFLIVDCKYKTEPEVYKYFLRSGYNKHGTARYTPLYITRNSNRINLLERLVEFFLFYDFYKFLLHNPYESLGDNEHFTRTRDQLIARSILKKVL